MAALAVAASTSALLAVGVAAVGAQTSIWTGIYTETQARRGEQTYGSNCSYCHRDDLSGGFFDDGNGRAPALAGARAFDSSFAERWQDASIGEMLAAIAGTMPKQQPASLTLQAYVDILAYLLSKNAVPAGSRELSTNIEELQELVITAKPDR
jgi:cytochrome c